MPGTAPGTRKLALTYDDGPNDPCTGQLLDVLEKHRVKATFFLLGRFVTEQPRLEGPTGTGRIGDLAQAITLAEFTDSVARLLPATRWGVDEHRDHVDGPG